MEFDYNSDKIRESSYPELDNIYENALEADLALEVHGHTDDVGSKKFNKDLSARRANAVKTYFLQKGMSENRVASEGFGESKPKVNNKTEGGRMVNRRVEVLFKKM